MTKQLKCKTEQTVLVFSLPRTNIRGGESVRRAPYLHPITQLEADRVDVIGKKDLRTVAHFEL